MAVRRPSEEELQRIAQLYNFQLTAEELTVFRDFMDNIIASYEWLDTLPEPGLPVRYPRDAGWCPVPAENPYGAWAWRCSIKGAAEGPLVGKKVVLKDNIAVQGLPLLNGSALMEGYIPAADATIVTRLLDAGAEIVGKTVCEDLCFSGGSHTSCPWPVRNPHDPQRMAGGSSSGSAVVVATGEADIAIGGDQGGSIRIPASWCGIYGLKPTYGLVPYTGIFPIELTLDHTGPMARSVADLAQALEAIAGRDGLDPRQGATPEALPRYSQELEGGARGLRIGIVREGFGWPGISEADVDEAVRDAAHRFAGLGAQVREISVPLHREGVHFWNGVGIEGTWAIMVRGEGMGHGWLGYYDTALVEFYGRSRRVRAQDFSPTVKMVLLLGHYLGERYHGRYYARGQNLRRTLRAAYDAALQEVDLLAMPTTPQKAQPFPTGGLADYIAAALNMINNTCPFDVTGHPAINVPCGESGGLPIGLMLVGRHFEEATLLRATYAFERAVYAPRLAAATRSGPERR